jgi:HK97 family phage prohead protease
MYANLEKRFAPSPTVAAPWRRVCVRQTENGGKQLVGWAAVFFRADDPGTEYELAPGLVERISPGCFDRSLRERDDVVALLNHEPSSILGRRLAGTLELSVDKKGLRFICSPPSTVPGDVAIKGVERGDITGASFAFVVERQKFVISDDPKRPDVRWLEDVSLSDVSVVTFPAYQSTSVGARCNDGRDDVLKQWAEARAKLGKSLKAADQGEMRRQLTRVEREIRHNEAEREAARVGSLKKMREQLRRAEAADRIRVLEAVEANLRRPSPQHGGYPLTPKERQIWLAARAQAHLEQ